MNDQPTVSVIVPVYNAGEYLRPCLDSILSQTMRSFELILVDDGSTDGSAQVLRETAARDPRVILLSQQNLYAGTARNNGMDHARGRYLLFLDADDIFETGMLAGLTAAAEANRADITVCGFTTFDDATGKTVGVFDVPRRGVWSGRSLGRALFTEITSAPWNKLYRREFVEQSGVRFMPLRNCNDTFFTKMTAALAERIAFTDRRYIRYRRGNENSLQGNALKGGCCFGEAVTALGRELKKRGLLTGGIEASFIDLCEHGVRLYTDTMKDAGSLAEYCAFMRWNVLTELFKEEERRRLLPKDSVIADLMRYPDQESFLFARLCVNRRETAELRASCVSRLDRSFRLGHALLAPLRAARSFLRRLRVR